MAEELAPSSPTVALRNAGEAADISPRWCAHQNCRRRPFFGLPGGRPMYCTQHSKRTEGMVDVSNRRCEAVGCAKWPLYGTEGQKAKFCSLHKLPSMIDVRSRRCQSEGCKRQPSYGFEGSRACFCTAHKAEGMVDVVSRRCEFARCRRRPLYGYEGQKSQYCSAHKQDGQVDVCNRRCDKAGCSKRPCFGLPGQRPQFCSSHRTSDMVDVISHKCNYPGCSHPAGYEANRVRSNFCAAHKSAGLAGASLLQLALSTKDAVTSSPRGASLPSDDESGDKLPNNDNIGSAEVLNEADEDRVKLPRRMSETPPSEGNAATETHGRSECDPPKPTSNSPGALPSLDSLLKGVKQGQLKRARPGSMEFETYESTPGPRASDEGMSTAWEAEHMTTNNYPYLPAARGEEGRSMSNGSRRPHEPEVSVGFDEDEWGPPLSKSTANPVGYFTGNLSAEYRSRPAPLSVRAASFDEARAAAGGRLPAVGAGAPRRASAFHINASTLPPVVTEVGRRASAMESARNTRQGHLPLYAKLLSAEPFKSVTAVGGEASGEAMRCRAKLSASNESSGNGSATQSAPAQAQQLFHVMPAAAPYTRDESAKSANTTRPRVSSLATGRSSSALFNKAMWPPRNNIRSDDDSVHSRSVSGESTRDGANFGHTTGNKTSSRPGHASRSTRQVWGRVSEGRRTSTLCSRRQSVVNEAGAPLDEHHHNGKLVAAWGAEEAEEDAARPANSRTEMVCRRNPPADHVAFSSALIRRCSLAHPIGRRRESLVGTASSMDLDIRQEKSTSACSPPHPGIASTSSDASSIVSRAGVSTPPALWRRKGGVPPVEPASSHVPGTAHTEEDYIWGAHWNDCHRSIRCETSALELATRPLPVSTLVSARDKPFALSQGPDGRCSMMDNKFAARGPRRSVMEVEGVHQTCAPPVESKRAWRKVERDDSSARAISSDTCLRGDIASSVGGSGAFEASRSGAVLLSPPSKFQQIRRAQEQHHCMAVPSPREPTRSPLPRRSIASSCTPKRTMDVMADV